MLPLQFLRPSRHCKGELLPRAHALFAPYNVAVQPERAFSRAIGCNGLLYGLFGLSMLPPRNAKMNDTECNPNDNYKDRIC
jgi:hypothetical protein